MGWTVWRNAGRADGRDLARLRRRPEYDLQQACRQRARLLGLRPWHLSQPRATKQSAGLPDDLYTGGPQLLAVEYKVGRNQQTPAQRAFEQAWTASGGLYVVVRDADRFEAGLSTWLGRTVTGE
jgi:hypothetical protein